MADGQLTLTEFPLSAEVDIKFDASDITRALTPLQTFNLIAELDEQVNHWEYTILMYRFFKAQVDAATEHYPELLAMTDAELESRLITESLHRELGIEVAK